MDHRKATLQIAVEEQYSTFSGGKNSQKILKSAEESFHALGTALGNAAEQFWESLKITEAPKPKEVELSLNLVLEGQGNWVVVSGKAGANVGVKMIWGKE